MSADDSKTNMGWEIHEIKWLWALSEDYVFADDLLSDDQLNCKLYGMICEFSLYHDYEMLFEAKLKLTRTI